MQTMLGAALGAIGIMGLLGVYLLMCANRRDTSDSVPMTDERRRMLIEEGRR